MKTTQEINELGADAFIEHVMPLVRQVSNQQPKLTPLVYSGCLGAMWGSMVADFGHDFAGKMLDMMVEKLRAMPPLERMQ